jgi:hypothetical protein
MRDSHQYTTAPRMILMDARQDRRLVMAQYVAIAWPHAEVVEWERSLEALTESADDWNRCSALLVWIDPADAGLMEEVRRALDNPPNPPIIAVSDEVDRVQTLLHAEHMHYIDWRRTDRHQVAQIISAAIEDREQWLRNRARTVPLDGPTRAARDKSSTYRTREALGPIRGYRVISKLGDGAMSRVFAAERQSDGQKLVLKVFDAGPTQDQERVSLFLKEYGILAKLDSPYVVRILDHGVTDQYAFIAMEHLEGGDLRDHMTQGKVTLTEKVAILGDILRALDVIHAAGVTHRDLKPQNLMFRRGGDLVLVDFGISHVSGALTASSHELVGTPVYVSPEQVLGQRTDARSDLYSVGAIFFEMLTGRHAYTGGTVSEILRKHVHDAPPRLPLDFSQFQDMSDRLLAKVPTERFQSARQALRYVHDRWLSQVASDPGGRPAPSRRH